MGFAYCFGRRGASTFPATWLIDSHPCFGHVVALHIFEQPFVLPWRDLNWSNHLISHTNLACRAAGGWRLHYSTVPIQHKLGILLPNPLYLLSLLSSKERADRPEYGERPCRRCRLMIDFK